MIRIEAIIFYILLIDSIMANIFAFCCTKWYKKKYKNFSKIFPLTKGWTIAYLILVLWIGSLLYRFGFIF